MRTYRLNKVGSIDGLVAVSEDKPSPGTGEVLVRVRASSLNFRDLAIVYGWFPVPPRASVVPLSDGAGEIEMVGAGVTRFKVGDRVANNFCIDWFGGPFNANPRQYALTEDGWLTDYRVVSEEALVHLPEHLSFEEGAALPCAAVTAWSALIGVSAGDTVLTQGTGGVSLFAVQLANALGARVIATTSSDEKAERLTRLGADHVVNYKSDPEWGETARSLTGGRGVDRVVEVGGPVTMPQSLKAVALGGQISLIGILGGSEPSGIDFMSVFLSFARVQPISVGSRRDFEDMNRVIAQHKIAPVIDKVVPFDQAKAAFEHLAERHLFGKIVVRH